MHLVTGAAGYVGSNICNKLVNLGEDVIGIDILDRPSNLNKNVKFKLLNILDDTKLSSILNRVDFVHHNAALVPLTKSGRRFREVNVLGTQKILKLSIEKKVKHFSHMSSSAVFGIPSELPLTNLSSRIPAEIYGTSKKDAEDIVLGALNEKSTTVSIIRPRTILGGGRLGIFELLFRWIKNDQPIFLIGEGDGLFQFAHIDDIAYASINSCKQCKGGIFNVGTTTFNTLYDDLDSFIKAVNSKSRIITLPEKITIKTLTLFDKLGISPFAPWHYLTYSHPFYFESEDVFQRLNYSPKGSNIDYLIESYESFLNQKDIVNNKLNKSPHTKPLKEGIISLAANLVGKLF